MRNRRIPAVALVLCLVGTAVLLAVATPAAGQRMVDTTATSATTTTATTATATATEAGCGKVKLLAAKTTAPDPDGAPIGFALAAGRVVDCLDIHDGWVRVALPGDLSAEQQAMYPDGWQHWVPAAVTEPVPAGR